MHVQADGDACALYRTQLQLVENIARLLHPDSVEVELHALHGTESEYTVK